MQKSPSTEIISTGDYAEHDQHQNDQLTTNQSLQYLVSSLSSLAPRRYANEGLIKINVLDVCANGAQQLYFNLAMDKIKDDHPRLFLRLCIEHRNNKLSKEKKWSPSDISQWLMDSDIHIILSHVHQGMLIPYGFDWSINIIENELSKLMNHRGFPEGDNLKCPIFLQDKWRYLVAVKDIVLDTLKVPFPIDLEDSSVVDRITKFCAKHSTNEKFRFIIKLPYTTNQRYYAKTKLAGVLRHLKHLSDEWSGVNKYAMVQPYLTNKKEYKVVCFNGIPLYETRGTSPSNAYQFGTPVDRFEFARGAINKLRLACPEALVSGLARVDIMVDDDGRMVVNEFESLEAGHSPASLSLPEYSYLVRNMSKYYYNIVLSYAREILKE